MEQLNIAVCEDDRADLQHLCRLITANGASANVSAFETGEDFLAACQPDRFDLIFMDAAKGQYLTWLPAVLERLRPGGVLISDNVLQEGDILQSRFAVERRDRTIHSRMRGYLSRLKRMEELETAIVPIGDGVTVSVKKCKGSWIDRDRHLWT